MSEAGRVPRWAVIYHRTSLADQGDDPVQWVAQLERFAEMMDLRVIARLVDNHPRHDGPRPELERLWESIEVAEGAPGALLCRSLATVFRSPQEMVMGLEKLKRLDVAVVATEDQVNALEEGGQRELRGAVRIWALFESRRHSETTRVGILRQKLKAAGQESAGAGRRVVVNRLEVKALYEDGHPRTGAFLSHRDIVKHIKRQGGQMSNGTLHGVLREMRELGELDEAKREAKRAKTPRPKGGRPPKKISYDLEEITMLRSQGCGPKRILDQAQGLSKNVKLHDVERILQEHRL